MTLKRFLFLCLALGLAQTTLAADRPNYCAKARMQNRDCVGLVLSGGGARGLAHIGVIRALENLNIPVDIITSTSMGSIVGGSYAVGYRADEIDRFARSIDWSTMFALRPPRKLLPWREKDIDMKGYAPAQVGVSSKGLQLPTGITSTQELHIFFSSFTKPASRVTDLGTLPIAFAAMATDLETGKRVVLQKDIRLQEAIRASMSVPGVFSPVQVKGHLLVDGGLVDNLPVTYAREMGAKRLIVVNVGTPLSDRDSLGNVFGGLGQMINILTEQNVRESIQKISAKDVFIEPNLENYNSSDFDKIDELSAIGYKATMAKAEKLKSFAISETAFWRWSSNNHRFIEEENFKPIESVHIEGVTPRVEERLFYETDLNKDELKSETDVANLSRRIWSAGEFATASYRYDSSQNGDKLIFSPEFKPTGDQVLRVGINAETDFNVSNTFNLKLMHVVKNVGPLDATWTNEVQVGNERLISTDLMIPFGLAQKWFVNPYLSYTSNPYNLYKLTFLGYSSEKHPSIRYRQEDLEVGARFGRMFENNAILYLNAGYLKERSRNDITLIDVHYDYNGSYVGAGFVYDTLDSQDFPSSGLFAKADVTRYFVKDDGERTTDTIHSAELLIPFGNSGDWIGHVQLKTERATTGADIHMGGVFNFSGSPYGRFMPSRMIFGRVMVAKNISSQMARMHMPVYLGATFEAGRIRNGIPGLFNGEDKLNLKAASVFLGFDSLIGPIYLVAGRTFGHSDAITLYWGHLH